MNANVNKVVPITNEQPKTVEQLKEELRVAQEAVAKVEREAREKVREAEYAERAAKEKAKQAACDEKAAVKLQHVYDVLVAEGIRCELRGLQIVVNPSATSKYDYACVVNIEEDFTRGSRYSSGNPIGTFTVVLGERYRENPPVRYPQLKTGFHNAKKIAAKIKERLEQKAAAAKRESEKLTAEARAAQFAIDVRVQNGYAAEESYDCPIKSKQEHSYPKGNGRYEYTKSFAPEGRVFVAVGTRTLTPEQVKVMLAALKQIKAMEPKQS